MRISREEEIKEEIQLSFFMRSFMMINEIPSGGPIKSVDPKCLTLFFYP